MNCLFCKIIKGEIPCYKIYDDEYTLAFLDISNDVDGHTLVVSKQHYENILDCDKETLNHVMNTTKLISNHYVEHCNYTGINLINSSGSSAEQVIKHLHVHIIPSVENDNICISPKFNISKNTLEENLEKLKIN